MTKAGYIAMTLSLGLRPDEALQMVLISINLVYNIFGQQSAE